MGRNITRQCAPRARRVICCWLLAKLTSSLTAQRHMVGKYQRTTRHWALTHMSAVLASSARPAERRAVADVEAAGPTPNNAQCRSADDAPGMQQPKRQTKRGVATKKPSASTPMLKGKTQPQTIRRRLIMKQSPLAHKRFKNSFKRAAYRPSYSASKTCNAQNL